MMESARYFIIIILILSSFCSIVPAKDENGTSEYQLGIASANFMARKYGKVEDESMRSRVNAIWKKINQVADKRSGIQYSIDIVDTDEIGAWAYPGGFIIVTKGLVNLANTDDELAFVIAHEVGHQAKGHVDRPIEKELEKEYSSFIEEKGIDGQGFVNEFISGISRQKELEADQYGFLYTSIAGYDALSAFSILDKVMVTSESSTHPDAESRKKMLQNRLNDIIGNLELFKMGVVFYNIEEYDYAESLFRSFLSVYPSREVYNNLAATLHQKALTYYIPKQDIPTAKTIQIDTETRAEDTARNVTSEEIAQFQSALNQSIEAYKKAIDQDPEYVISYNNIGCAYDDLGEMDFAFVYLKKAIKKQKDYKEAYNNLGVVNIHQGDFDEAIANLEKAIELDKSYAEAYFNLAMVYDASGGSEQLVTQNLMRFLEYDDGSQPNATKITKEKLGIKIDDEPKEEATESKKVQVFQRRNEIEKTLGLPTHSVKLIPDDNIEVYFYPEKGAKLITAGARGKVIGMIVESENAGSTPKGIKVSQSKEQLTEAYGKPSKVRIMGGLTYLLYYKDRLLFSLQEGKIKSWVMLSAG